MATLRNLAVTLLRMAGATNVAKAAHLAGIVDVLTDVERRGRRVEPPCRGTAGQWAVGPGWGRDSAEVFADGADPGYRRWLDPLVRHGVGGAAGSHERDRTRAGARGADRGAQGRSTSGGCPGGA